MTFSSGINSIDALALSSWNSLPHTAATITYDFMPYAPSGAPSDVSQSFLPLIAEQRQAVRVALDQWAQVANLTFTEKPGFQGQINFGTNNQGSASGAWSTLPDPAKANDLTFTFFNNRSLANYSFDPGSFGKTTFLHEIGHDLGLKHPGNYNASGTGAAGPFLPAETDTTDYSLMSYHHGKSAAINGMSPSTPMLYDIQAIQYLYGANMQFHSGDDTYQFSALSAPQCIWDAGGNNTFDFSATAERSIIDLHAGSFSETAPGLNNISIAYGVTIQNALGGSNNDIIYANDGTVSINSAGGDDIIYAGAGADIIDGGSGNDVVVLSGPQAAYSFFRAGDSINVQNRSVAGNTFSISNVETLGFSDGQLNAGAIPAGSAPLLQKALANVTTGYGQAFRLQVPADTFADPDAGDVLHYSASLANGSSLPSWLQFDAASHAFSIAPGAGQPGNTQVRVTATDLGGHFVSSDFAISSVLNFGQQFVATSANDQFTGTSALDIAVFDGPRASYTISKTGQNTYTVAQTNGSTDTLVNIDRLKFADASVAIDISGHGGQAYGLYQAAFNRTPDAGGLGFWINSLDDGLSLQDVAHAFITSPEFIATYSNLDTISFVNQIYQNVLHRAADPGGAAFWQAGIDSGGTNRQLVLLNFTQSAEFQGNLVTAVGNGFSFTPFLS